MKQIYYTYNNEALASCILLSITSKVNSIDLSRCCLVLPFLLNDRIVSRISAFDDDQIELQNFISSEPRLFRTFNKQYLSLLPVTINSLLILNKGNQIKIEKEISGNAFFDPSKHDLGERFAKIQQVIPVFLKLIQNFTTAQLYKIFRIQL